MTGREYNLYKEGASSDSYRMAITDEMMNSRILFLDEPVCAETCIPLAKALLYLENCDSEAPVTLFVSSPGGAVDAGLALIDVMQSVSCPVNTVGLGTVASMAAVILASGDHRSAYANCQILIHQLMGGTGIQQQSDMEIAAEHFRQMRAKLDELLAQKSPYDETHFHDLTDRDCWCDAERALELGLIDEIISRKAN